MCEYVDKGGYWGLADNVSSGEHVQNNVVVLISAVRILFATIRKLDGAVIDKGDGSGFHPRICDTEARFSHSDV